MKLLVLAYTNEECTIRIEDTNPAFVNSLRRIIIAEIETVAVELVEITVNDSPICDEMLAHRIGLIPLVSSNIHLMSPSECTCASGQCSQCTVTFEINYTNTELTPQSIYSKHLQPVSEFAHQYKPCFDDILITKINPNSSLKLKAYAQKGTGSDHTKFNATCAVEYHFEPVILLDETIDQQPLHIKEELVQSCPQSIFKLNEQTQCIDIEDTDKCNYCHSCERLCRKYKLPDDILQVKPDESIITIKIESIGSIPALQILHQALNKLMYKSQILLAQNQLNDLMIL
jgi:DNA-directed RNA polymerase alpha subunit